MPNPEDFIRPFPRPQPPQEHPDEEDDASRQYEPPELSDKEFRRMMGINIEYGTFTEEEKHTYLGSEERITAFEGIKAATLPPQARAEQKRGIVSEFIKNTLVSDDILKNYPTVYLGSGGDIEYPLALGGRKIVLNDIGFGFPDARQNIEEVLAAFKAEPVAENAYRFSFDFGQGPEEVEVTLEPGMYSPSTDAQAERYGRYELPEQVGLILTFILNSPEGFVKVGEEAASHLVPGGAILEDSEIVRINPETQKSERTLVGKREE